MIHTTQQSDFLWDLVLELKSTIDSKVGSFAFAIDWDSDYSFRKHVELDEGEGVIDCKLVVSYNRTIKGSFEMFFSLEDGMHWPKAEGSEEDLEFGFLKKYIPYILLQNVAIYRQKTITVGHLAMSLDGKIATNAGNSQWIGNQENQVHSHRMRAISDAILVGGNTFLADQPQLNVRHVKGEDPVKIVMGDGQYDLSQYACEDCTIWVNSIHDQTHLSDQLFIKRNDKGFDCNQLLRKLFDRGIRVVFIEGGGVTLSGFIQNRALDVLQLHYAPIVMGSGISGLSLPEIVQVDESIAFSESSFDHMDDEWMFTGIVDYKK